MASMLLVQPDRKFLRDVMHGGAADLKKCFQCATCTSVCSLSTESSPFPRKQMIEAQWGMTDRLMTDPAVWLCHNCGDCTTRCPRDARPAQVMGAIRSEVIRRFAFPRFMGDLVHNPRTLPLLFAIPILVFYALAAPLHAAGAQGWEFALMFPQPRLEALFFTVGALVGFAFVVGVVRFVQALRASGAKSPILLALVPVLVEIMTHRRFAKCDAEKDRYWGHLLMLYGFGGLALVGTVIGIGTLAGVMHTPLPILSPLKVFANLCALVALVGAVILVAGRLKNREALEGTTYFDWFFLLVLAIAVMTGILSEGLRLMQNQAWMYPVYFVHLTLILALFLYAPYSKFAHFVYRTVALAATWEQNRPLSADQESVATGTLASTGS